MNLDLQRLEHVLDVAGAEENAAVGFLGDLEFHVEDEVAVALLRPDRVMITRDEFTVREGPLAGFDGVRQISRKQILPALRIGMVGGKDRERDGAEREDGEAGEFHGGWLFGVCGW